MNKNIFAYTELVYKQYPGYISLNEREGKFYLTVRSQGSTYGQEIEVSAKELRKLEDAIFTHVGD